MKTCLSLLLFALTVLAALGCCGTTAPPESPPAAAPTPVPRIETGGPPRQIQRQITVMGKNGPEVITITETVNGGAEKRPRYPYANSSGLPRAASQPEVLTSRPKTKEQ